MERNTNPGTWAGSRPPTRTLWYPVAYVICAPHVQVSVRVHRLSQLYVGMQVWCACACINFLEPRQGIFHDAGE